VILLLSSCLIWLTALFELTMCNGSAQADMWCWQEELEIFEDEFCWTVHSCDQMDFVVGINDHDKGTRNSYIGLHWAFWGIIPQGIFVRLATVYIHAKCGQST
jgi:hypothetical protein